MEERRYFHREVSWLSFNHRVLQEAMDPKVPLFQRLKFLAIFSSNLDEFYRVRVATLGSYKKLDESTQKATGGNPRKILKQIRHITQDQQEEFGRVFRNELLPALLEVGVQIIEEDAFTEADRDFAQHYFEEEIKKHIRCETYLTTGQPPFLENRTLYFLVGFEGERNKYGLVNIPSFRCPRFISLPSGEGEFRYTFLDEILRVNLPEIFPGFSFAYSVKMSRDADLGIEDEFSGDLLEQIKKGLKDRNVGLPTRLLYDAAMPQDFLKTMKAVFDLQKNELIPGARQHNFHDFFGFPNPTGREDLEYQSFHPLDHPTLEFSKSIIAAVQEKDQLLHYPYQKVEYIPRLLREAADHPNVEQISITLYRVARDSAIVSALIYALQKGKKVMAFMEVKARFDEAHNLHWGEKLEKAGARVLYSFPGIKVHSKVLQISFRKESPERDICYLSTGNFNEKTSRVYCDYSLITAHQGISADVDQLFKLLDRQLLIPQAKHLLIAPYTIKNRMLQLIQREIDFARSGQEAFLIFKLNNLEDKDIIEKLYLASQAGVHQFLIIRGICCLKPGVQGMSENIRAMSIVDRFLEHGRVFIFGNGGKEEMYVGSADLMTRNLEHRIEVLFPILDKHIYRELRKVISIQMQDHVKARWINLLLNNPYRQPQPGKSYTRSQTDTYKFLRELIMEEEEKKNTKVSADAS